jgi:glutaredoxin
MRKKTLFWSFIFLSIFVLSGCQSATGPAVDEGTVLFYSDQCPHCKDVEKYIADNDIKSKVEFSEKEVSTDRAGANLMMNRQKECQVAKEQIGSIPFLWSKEGCYMGSDEIIQYFKDKSVQ